MSYEFKPDWVSAPGATIKDLMDERGINALMLAGKLDMQVPEVLDLLQGKMAIDSALADKLAALFGPTAAFWLKRQEQYDADKVRLGL